MRGLVKISSQEETRPTDPDPRPLLLSIETPSALGPVLTYRLHVAWPTLDDVTIYFDTMGIF